MSDHYKTLQLFFADLGFAIIEKVRSGSFDNYVIEACSPYFCIKGVCDRSFEFIEIRSVDYKNEWFILNIVMTLVNGESKLTQELGLHEQMDFLRTHLDDLKRLFEKENYPDTKLRLQELVRYRGKLLFPEWYK